MDEDKLYFRDHMDCRECTSTYFSSLHGDSYFCEVENIAQLDMVRQIQYYLPAQGTLIFISVLMGLQLLATCSFSWLRWKTNRKKG